MPYEVIVWLKYRLHGELPERSTFELPMDLAMVLSELDREMAGLCPEMFGAGSAQREQGPGDGHSFP